MTPTTGRVAWSGNLTMSQFNGFCHPENSRNLAYRSVVTSYLSIAYASRYTLWRGCSSSSPTPSRSPIQNSPAGTRTVGAPSLAMIFFGRSPSATIANDRPATSRNAPDPVSVRVCIQRSVYHTPRLTSFRPAHIVTPLLMHVRSEHLTP